MYFYRFVRIILVSAFSALLLVGCGGGETGDEKNNENSAVGVVIKTGKFLDSAVEGARYESGDLSGFTDNEGKFEYEEGRTLKFSVGDIVIGEAVGKSLLTPVDLVLDAHDVTHPTVANIIRFLMTIDDNDNPDDGIKITNILRDSAKGLSVNFSQTDIEFENDGSLQITISELTALRLTGARALITKQEAYDHFNATLKGLLVGVWELVSLDGAPSNVDGTNSKLSFKTDGTYDWFLNLANIDEKGGGNYQYEGDDLIIDGVIAEAVNAVAEDPNHLGLDMGDGIFSFEDDEGNKWTYRKISNLPKDITSPETTILSGLSDPENPTSVTFYFESREAGALFQCSLDGGDYVNCVSPITYSGLSQANHSFSVRGIDAAGNVDLTSAGPFSWAGIISPPETIIVSHPFDPTSLTSATFGFVSSGTSTLFQCSLDGGVYETCTSSTTYNNLAIGNHSFKVRAIDGAGNADQTPAPYNWTVYIVPFPTTIRSGPNHPSAVTTATFTFDSNEESSTFECDLDGAGFTACTSPKPYIGLSEGDHNFRVLRTNSAGNTDSIAAGPYYWKVDITLPETTIIAVPYSRPNVSAATFTFDSNEAGSSFECNLDGAGFTVCARTVSYLNLAEGSHTLQVRAVDTAVNRDSTPAIYSWATPIVINNNSSYAVVLDELSVRLFATDNTGVTAYLVAEHNATDPTNVIPSYLDPFPTDSNWIPVTGAANFNESFTHALTQAYNIGDTVEICVWFKDGLANISERVCDSITHGVDWENGLSGLWSPNNQWQVGGPPAVGPMECFNQSTSCAGAVLEERHTSNAGDLISPAIDLPTITATQQLALQYWSWTDIMENYQGDVYVQTESSPGIWGEGSSLASYTGASTVWTRPTVDLSAYAGQRIRLVFRLWETDSSFYSANASWYIDDVRISIKQDVNIPLGSAYAMNFEAGQGDWWVHNSQWQVGGPPAAGPMACYNQSTSCAGTVLDGNHTSNTGDLISPVIDLPTITATQQLALQYWSWTDIEDNHQGDIYVQTESSPGVWGESSSLASYTGSSTVWTRPTIDLSTYAGQRVRLVFRLRNTGSSSEPVSAGWYIDDLLISKF